MVFSGSGSGISPSVCSNSRMQRRISQSTEIVSGGAAGIDRYAAQCAQRNGWKLKEFLPDYRCCGRAAPLIRNRQIADYADAVIAFWDGRSRGTAYTVDYCRKIGKKVRVIRIQKLPDDP